MRPHQQPDDETHRKAAALLERLAALGSERNRQGMARYGINTDNAHGIPVGVLRGIAREHRRDHALAATLWASGVHEARHLAHLIDDPRQVTEEQMESWVSNFDSWDICDGCCNGLFSRTPYAHEKAAAWARRPEEFVRRAGFVLMACLAVHDKKAPDEAFLAFLPLIAEGAQDERNFVKKAVNWALRQTGKRNARLNAEAAALARTLRAAPDSRAARWVGSDALRELQSEAVQDRLRAKSAR